MIIDGAGQTAGYAWLAAKRWSNKLQVFALQLAATVNWQAAAPCLLRAFCAHGQQLPTIEENNKPFGEIRFNLGRTHPLYDVLADLRAFLPDVWANAEATPLINTLFPTQPSIVHSLNNV